MSSKLKIITDIDCQIYCDYEYVGDAISGRIFHLNLRKGIYLLEFKKDTIVLATQRYKMESNEEEDLLEISLVDVYNDIQKKEYREKIKNLHVSLIYTVDNWMICSTRGEILNTVTNECCIALPGNYVLLPSGRHRDPDIDECGYIPFNVGGTLYYDGAGEPFVKGGMWGCINKVGEVVIPPKYSSKVFFWNDQVTTIVESQVFKEVINYLGEPVFLEFGSVLPINQVIGWYRTFKDGRYGVINKYGNYLIQPRYAELEFTDKDCIWARDIDSNRWGLININSNVLLPFIYDTIHKVDGGYYVCSNGEWGSVTDDGAIVESHSYAIVAKFYIQKGVICDEYEYFSIVKKRGKYGIVNSDFARTVRGDERSAVIQEIIPCVYDAIYSKNGSKYSDEELAELVLPRLGYPEGCFKVDDCFFVTIISGQLECSRYKVTKRFTDYGCPYTIVIHLINTFTCEIFNRDFMVKSNKYHFINNESICEEESYDLISNIDFCDGTFDFQPNPDGWDGYGAPSDYIKVKIAITYPIAKKADTWYVFNNRIPRSIIFSCKCHKILEFGNLVCDEYFAVVERKNSQYLYIIDDNEIVFESEAFKEIYSSYYHLRDAKNAFDDRYHVNTLTNDYFIVRKTIDKYSVLKWWSSRKKMLYSQEYDYIHFIDEYYAEVVLHRAGRSIYNIVSALNNDEEFTCKYDRNWLVSPYNERKYNWVAAYNLIEQKEGVMLDPNNGETIKVIIPFEYDYARIFGGQKSIIICLGRGTPKQIAVLDVNKRHLTTEIFDHISVGEQITDLTFHIDDYHADVNLNNEDPIYCLPFLDFDTYTESGEKIRKNPFKNVRLYIDTETTGLPIDYKEHYAKLENWPYIVQVALIIEDDNYGILAKRDIIVKPDGYTIPESASQIHSITNEKAEHGEKREDVFNYLDLILNNTDIVIGHNASFDLNIIKAEIVRTKGLENVLFDKKAHTIVDTMRLGKDVCKIPGNVMYGDYKYPKLDELYYKLFNKHFENQHTAMADVEATYECYKELLKISEIN